MIPSFIRFLYRAREVRYRIRLPGEYLFCLSGCNITGPAAVFAVFVAIALKLLSAVLAYEIIVGFSADILLVTVPPGHSAGIGAEFLFPAAFGLHQWLAAILTSFRAWDNRVAVDVRTHRSFG